MFTIETGIYITVLIGVGILTIFIVYFLITTFRQQKQKRRLEKKLLAAELESIEKERNRIARDLHDELSPLLASVRFQLMTLDTEEKNDIIKTSIINIEESLKSIKTITAELEPVNLSKKGIWSTIADMAERINKSTQLQLSLSFYQTPSVPRIIEVHLFRIVNEIIHNCLKHAKADKMVITVRSKKSDLQIIIEDNGVGFDYLSKMQNAEGLGLKNILNRVNFLEGRLYTESKPENGSYYKIEIPYLNAD
jgi:signal transduction histidine kinase